MRARLHNTASRSTVALLGALALGCGLSACGGSSSQSAQSLVNDTFSARSAIESGQVSLSVGVSGTGSSSSSKPASVSLSGPFQNAGAGKLPHFSLKLSIATGAHALQAGATSTGSALYVQLGGSWFVTPQSTLQSIEQSYAQATKSAGQAKLRSAFSSLGIEPAHWLSNPSNAGTATVAGVQTDHITAEVDVPAFLSDVAKLSQSGSSLGLSALPDASSLSPAAISELGKSIHSAHVDIYTGASDHLLRELDLTASVTSSSATQSLLGGLSSATISVRLLLSDINQPQTIAAPPSPKPFSQLLPELQQLVGALEGASGSSGSEASALGSLGG